jgi:hypothetical protein
MLQLISIYAGGLSTFNIPNNECSWKQHKSQYYLTTFGKLQDRDHCCRDTEQNEIVYEGQPRVRHVDDAPIETFVGSVRCLLEGTRSAQFSVWGTVRQPKVMTETRVRHCRVAERHSKAAKVH